jgi:putative GTP pyrophosphokinase
MKINNVTISNNQIRKAGDVLAGRETSIPVSEAYEIMNAWRSFHNIPLNTMQMNLRKIAKRFSKNALIAQRLKRAESIINKLIILPKMPLSNMQDIAGCRAVMPGMNEVKSIFTYLDNTTKMQHERVRTANYIEEPKESGYRSIHLIYKYKSNNVKNKVYNGCQIEMQIRTLIQHSWATAVETAGMFLDTALKSNQGPENWKYFFRLTGSLFAYLENNPIDNKLGTIKGIRRSIIAVEKELGAIKKLNLYNNSIKIAENKKRVNDKYYVLELDSNKKTLNVYNYARDEFDLASKMYVEKEKDREKKDIVLVSVNSINLLKRAYPNYFVDTSRFISNFNKALEASRR